jgi:ligand-binding sensor domain-containing protein
MKSVRTWKIIVASFWCMLFFTFVSYGQSYRFRNYGTGKIPDTFIYTINQDNAGFLWIGTGSGLVRFDGFVFSPIVFPDSVTNRSPSVSLKDKNGNLWIGCNDGSMFLIKDGTLKKLPDLEVQSINDAFESSDGFIWIIPQDRTVIKINENNLSDIKRFGVSRDIQMTSGRLAPNGKILIGTQQNLLYCGFDKD